MMKKSKVYLFTNTILLVAILSLSFTYAWLIYIDSLGEGSFVVGDVKFILQGSVISKNIIVPGEELINQTLALKNESTVDCELRAFITFDYVEIVNEEPTVKTWIFGKEKDESKVNNPELLGTISTGWFYDSDDEIWYYVGNAQNVTKDKVGSDASEEYKYIISSSQTNPISFIESLKYDGEIVDNTWSNQTVTINIVFEAKQANYVTWSELGTYSIKVGL
jgi:hypothetical protein